jgi:hypothetical protein
VLNYQNTSKIEQVIIEVQQDTVAATQNSSARNTQPSTDDIA